MAVYFEEQIGKAAAVKGELTLALIAPTPKHRPVVFDRLCVEALVFKRGINHHPGVAV